MTEQGDDYSNLPAEAASGNKEIETDTAAAVQPQAHPNAVPASNSSANYASPAFVTGLTRWHPGIGFFQFLSDCSFPQSQPPYVRFNNCMERHPHLYKVCVGIDLAIIIAVLIGLAVVAVVLGWNALT